MLKLKLQYLATWWEELTHLKRPWFWERLRTGGEGDDRGWDGWMASPTQWTWVWVVSRNWWRTGRSGVLSFMGIAKSRTQLSNWTEPTRVFWPGEFHGLYSPWGCEESYWLSEFHSHFFILDSLHEWFICVPWYTYTYIHDMYFYIGEGNGNPLQCSCLENPRDRGAWWAAVYGVAQSRTRLKRLSSSSSSRLNM